MNADNVNNIIKVLNSGKDFYQHAIDKVDNSGLVMVFRSMVDARNNALIKLQPFAQMTDGEREAGDSWVVKAREAYADLRAALSKDPDHTYIEQLEEVEDKTLVELKTALNKTSEPLYAAVLKRSALGY
ncbi:PA2169 family four-helix-bundle protein [Simiduia curdlanivorans]|uniref:PA2169 family four-helix-bundle protein n=1 Tax=Simiduia curdlanivorans TaxID=1492769 RepID=UPI0025B5A56C|nr:PA2169 family four-helix-bundle protein [Simiduia curdlanivorans]MDN3641044.1 PA2169 family four-helix-bundle protein [Simiduia curdlanivorans]